MESDVPYPKMRKAVHKVMLIYRKKRFYRKCDWIDKVLRRLKEKPTKKLKARIRNHINAWLRENSEVDTQTDSKKGLKDSKATVDPTNNVGENSNNSNPKNQRQVQEEHARDQSKTDSSNFTIPQMPQGIPIKKLREIIKKAAKVPLIDLASEEEKQMKKNEVEVITIDDDDDIEFIDEKFPRQQLHPSANIPFANNIQFASNIPVANIPYQYYKRPDFFVFY